MDDNPPTPIEALIVAVPEATGSTLYGLVDMLSAAGNVWPLLVDDEAGHQMIRPRIISPLHEPFSCHNGVPVTPHFDVDTAPQPEIVILPELWLGPDEPMTGRHPEMVEWLRQVYRGGANIYSICSGAILLAETGLLDGRETASHWAYENLFRKHYPSVRFRPAPNLCFADPDGRIVTSSGITSWHDLVIHIISRYCGPGEALRIAKTYLLKWHGEGQLPYSSLVRRSPHADSAVRICEKALAENYLRADAIKMVVALSRLPERTLKRRFKSATGVTLIERVQHLRVEAAKKLLEDNALAADRIYAEVGYEDPAFFRRLFKRCTGLTPSQYRRMFQPVTQV